MDGELYRVDFELDCDSGWWVSRTRIVEEPPPIFGVLVGSIAHQCLSALNHVIWELAARKIGARNAEARKFKINFPIAKSESKFRDYKVLEYVSKPARSALESIQPYHRQPTPQHGRIQHPLFLIQEWANADKHRVLAASYGSVALRPLFSGEAITFDEPASGPNFERLLPDKRRERMLTHGTPLVRVRFAAGNEQANVRMEPQPTAELAFSSDTWAGMNLMSVGNMVATTDSCIDRLAHLFPKQSWPPESHDPSSPYTW